MEVRQVDVGFHRFERAALKRLFLELPFLSDLYFFGPPPSNNPRTIGPSCSMTAAEHSFTHPPPIALYLRYLPSGRPCQLYFLARLPSHSADGVEVALPSAGYGRYSSPLARCGSAAKVSSLVASAPGSCLIWEDIVFFFPLDHHDLHLFWFFRILCPPSC